MFSIDTRWCIYPIKLLICTYFTTLLMGCCWSKTQDPDPLQHEPTNEKINITMTEDHCNCDSFNVFPQLSREKKIKIKREGKESQRYTDEKQCGGKPLYKIQEEDMKNDIFHKSIVALVIENNSLEVRASGVLISPDLVLTSAHNLFDHKTKMEAKTVNCYIGVNGISKKIYNTDDFYYPKKFKSTNSAEYDYALIKLKDKVTEVEHNFLSLALFFNDLKASLAIFGYPCKDDDNFKVINQNGDERQIFQKGLKLKDMLVKIEDYILSYRISTNPGQSGCPVITGKNRNLVVGLHKAGARDGEYNIGRKVTLEMIIQMLVWIERHGGMKFQVINYKTGQQIDLNQPLLISVKDMFKSFQQNYTILQQKDMQNKRLKDIINIQDNQMSQKERKLWISQASKKEMKQKLNKKELQLQNMASSMKQISFKNKELEDQLTKTKEKYKAELSKSREEINCTKQISSKKQKELEQSLIKQKELEQQLIKKNQIYEADLRAAIEEITNNERILSKKEQELEQSLIKQERYQTDLRKAREEIVNCKQISSIKQRYLENKISRLQDLNETILKAAKEEVFSKTQILSQKEQELEQSLNKQEELKLSLLKQKELEQQLIKENQIYQADLRAAIEEITNNQQIQPKKELELKNQLSNTTKKYQAELRAARKDISNMKQLLSKKEQEIEEWKQMENQYEQDLSNMHSQYLSELNKDKQKHQIYKKTAETELQSLKKQNQSISSELVKYQEHFRKNVASHDDELNQNYWRNMAKKLKDANKRLLQDKELSNQKIDQLKFQLIELKKRNESSQLALSQKDKFNNISVQLTEIAKNQKPQKKIGFVQYKQVNHRLETVEELDILQNCEFKQKQSADNRDGKTNNLLLGQIPKMNEYGQIRQREKKSEGETSSRATSKKPRENLQQFYPNPEVSTGKIERKEKSGLVGH